MAGVTKKTKCLIEIIKEDFSQGQKFKETGNVPNAEQKSQSFLLNQPLTDQFIAENAGQKKGLLAISADNR